MRIKILLHMTYLNCMYMYLFLKSTNEADFDEQSGHVSSNGDVDSLDSGLTEREWFGPPP